MNATLPILVVEDNDEDFDMLRVTFRAAGIPNPLQRACDGEEALEYLEARGRYAKPEAAPRPGLVLLDLNLPGMDGRRVLERMKSHELLRGIPVVVISTSDNPRDVHACYQHGASGYLLKPVDLDRLEKLARSFREYWLEFAVVPEGAPRQAGHR